MPINNNPYYTTSPASPPIYSAPVYQQPPASSPYANSAQFIWVRGESEARAFPVSFGQSVLMMDRDSMTIYSKSVDMSGQTSFDVFDLVKREMVDTSQQQIDLSGYVKSEDLEAIVEKAVNKALHKKNPNRTFSKVKENGE